MASRLQRLWRRIDGTASIGGYPMEMQRMQFQARHPLRHNLMKGVEACRRIFAGQTDNKVSANVQSTLPRLGNVYVDNRHNHGRD